MSIAACYREPVRDPGSYAPDWTAKRVRGPDGSNNYYVLRCPSARADCYEGASEKCPNGYSVEDSDQTANTVSSSESSAAVHATEPDSLIGNHAVAHGRSSRRTSEAHDTTWLIRCRPPEQ